MQTNAIRPFVPSKDFDTSVEFYKALGFEAHVASDNLMLFQADSQSFFLQRFYHKAFAENLMLQWVVTDIEAAAQHFATLQNLDLEYSPIKEESWGRVIYLQGPSGELWQVTELHA